MICHKIRRKPAENEVCFGVNYRFCLTPPWLFHGFLLAILKSMADHGPDENSLVIVFGLGLFDVAVPAIVGGGGAAQAECSFHRH
jgi:hypothetical protein